MTRSGPHLPSGPRYARAHPAEKTKGHLAGSLGWAQICAVYPAPPHWGQVAIASKRTPALLGKPKQKKRRTASHPVQTQCCLMPFPPIANPLAGSNHANGPFCTTTIGLLDSPRKHGDPNWWDRFRFPLIPSMNGAACITSHQAL